MGACAWFRKFPISRIYMYYVRESRIKLSFVVKRLSSREAQGRSKRVEITCFHEGMLSHILRADLQRDVEQSHSYNNQLKNLVT